MDRLLDDMGYYDVHQHVACFDNALSNAHETARLRAKIPTINLNHGTWYVKVVFIEYRNQSKSTMAHTYRFHLSAYRNS